MTNDSPNGTPDQRTEVTVEADDQVENVVTMEQAGEFATTNAVETVPLPVDRNTVPSTQGSNRVQTRPHGGDFDDRMFTDDIL